MNMIMSITSYFVNEISGTVPIFLLLGLYLYLYCQYKERKEMTWHTWGIALFCAVTALIFMITGLPNVLSLEYIAFHPIISLIPFADGLDFGTISNVILFIPIGFFLPLLWKKYEHAGRTILTGFGVSLLIELLQLFTFRASDITDLITNTLGTLIGYGICLSVHMLMPHFSKKFQANTLSYKLSDKAGILCIILTLLLYFLVIPFQYNLIVCGL